MNMKIIRLTQAQTNQPSQAVVQEVIQAMTTLNEAVASINQDLETLNQTGVMQLFQKENLISAIQSGNAAALTPPNVQQALDAMGRISQSVLVLDNALRVLKDNEAVTKQLQMDYSVIVNGMIQGLQSGNYQALQSGMANFQQNLSGMSFTY